MNFRQLNDVALEKIVSVINQNTFESRSHLDIGCGKAEFLDKMSKYFDYSLGVDNALNTIIGNTKTHPKLNFEYCDLNTSFPEGKFNFISCNLVLAFIADKPKFLTNVANALCDSAIFVLSTPVTLKCFEYSRDYRVISVNLEETIRLLRANFRGYFRCEPEKRTHNQQRITWLLSNNPEVLDTIR